MFGSRVLRALIPLLAIVVLSVVPISASAQTQSDVDRAEAQVEDARGETKDAYSRWLQAREDLEIAIHEYEDVTTRLDNLNYRIAVIQGKITDFETDVETLQTVARELVIDAYVAGGTGFVTAAFEAGTIQDLLTSQTLIDSATSRDVADLDRLRTVSREMDRLKDDLSEQQAEVEVLEEQSAALVAKLDTLNSQASAAYDNASAEERAAIDNLAKERAEFQAAEARRRAEAEEARKRAEAAARAAASSSSSSSSSRSTASSSSSSSSTASSSSSSSGSASAGLAPAAISGFVCPVQGGASFIDSWGFPRSGGRRHKGVDMFNSRNTPLLAVVSGTVRFSSNSLGGRSTYVYGNDGNKYYYAHLERHPSGISSGSRVNAGDVVGYLGNSGNARFTSPHLHFEIRPGGGSAVNPYPTVRRACP
jgi:murein DD-endopeptidase MepM/ murein hydrolase activator NlpD